jgi:small subunit ribosomal protein S1
LLEEAKKEFLENVWPEVYASRQNRSILTWMVNGVEEHSDGNGTDKVLCMVVTKDRVKGIIPLPETGVEPAANKRFTRTRLQSYIGQQVAFVVIGIDKENEIFVGSRTEALKRLQAEIWPDLEEGDVKTATVRRIIRKPRKNGSVADIGAIVDLGGVEALLPVQELSHGWVEEIIDLIQPNDVLDVKIKRINRETRRVTVSVKDMLPNPWPDAARRYVAKGIYGGIVSGVANYGVFVSLEPGVDALCNHPKAGLVKKGDVVAIFVNEVNPAKQQIRGSISRVLRRV